METKLHILLAEIQEIKNKVQALEEENVKLREGLADACRDIKPAGEAVPDWSGARVKGLLDMLELYEQGFHVCNLEFGRRRGAECLFCVAFLRREDEPQGKGPEVRRA